MRKDGINGGSNDVLMAAAAVSKQLVGGARRK